MEYETYADVIDAYNADNMGYSTLTDYIKGQNIKIKEIEMDPIGDMQKIFENKADGGMIGIEVLFRDKKAYGGRVPAVSGGFLKLLLEGAQKGKQGIMELVETGKSKFDDFVETQANKKIYDVENFKPTVYPKSGPMTIEALEAVDDDIVRRLLRTQELGLNKETPEILKAANLLERFTKKVKGKRVIDYERAEAILGVPLKGDETINDLFKIEFETRPVEKMADGGRVGLFMGGPPLEGPALSIYNSMNATGATDQEIADRLQSLGYYTPPGSTPDTPSDNIIGAQLDQGGGGGGITELQKTFTTQPGDPKNFRLSQLEGEADYFPPTTMMGKTKNFLMENVFPSKVQGTLGDRLSNQPTIPLPGALMAYSRSPLNPESPQFNPLLRGQLNFLEASPMVTRKSGQFIDPKLGAVEGNFMDVTGALIGRDPNTGALKYGSGSVLAGKNVISGFGTNDYETALMDYIAKMTANKRISAAGKAARLAAAEAELEAERERQRQAGQRTTNQGTLDYGITQGVSQRDYQSREKTRQRSDRQDEGKGPGGSTFDYSDPYDPGGGEKDGGFIDGYNRRKYSDGGLATMFTRRR